MTEDELIRGCLRGEAQYQRQLYERFAGKMYAVCLRYARNPDDAPDILQDGFVRVFEKLGQFRSQGSFEGWIRRIMIHTALRAYQRRRFAFEKDMLESAPDPGVGPEALNMLSEAELLDLIARLPDGYRVIFNLVAIEGYSHAEVADALNIQESTSRSQLTKARKWLISELEKMQRINTTPKT